MKKRYQTSTERREYTVLNTSTKGFPDLIVLKGHNIEFFVEVKGGRHKCTRFGKQCTRNLKKWVLKLESKGFRRLDNPNHQT
jgi:hypothetical protein